MHNRKIKKAAEHIVMNVTRRRFLNQVGRGAMATVMVVSGMLAATRSSHASGKRICSSPSSFSECSGKPVGSHCSFAGGGVCATSRDAYDPKTDTYDCYYCKVSGTGNNGKGPHNPGR